MKHEAGLEPPVMESSCSICMPIHEVPCWSSGGLSTVSIEQNEPCWPGTVLSFNIHQLTFQRYKTEMLTNLPTTADEGMGAVSVPKTDRVIATHLEAWKPQLVPHHS